MRFRSKQSSSLRAVSESRRLLKTVKGNPFLKGEFADLSSWQKTFNHENVEILQAPYLFGAGTQWNPFSQRLIFYTRPKSRPFAVDFDDAYFDYFTLFSQYHEVLHLLLFESVYTGKLHLRSLEEFQNVYFGFEAIAVWHVEQRISPFFDFRFPNDERLSERRSVTQRNYSNVTAFKRMGLSSVDSLKIFQQSYLGLKTPLLDVPGIFSPNCAKRFYAFHLDSLKALSSMHQLLVRYQILDDFYARFCDIADLPTFLDPSVRVSSSAESILEFGLALTMKKSSAFEAALKRNRSEIKMRRHLQTRAYFGTLLKNVLQRGDFFSPSKQTNRAQVEAIIGSVELYLETLRALLLRLAAGAAPNALLRETKAADLVFSKTVRNPISHLDLWISRRYLFREPEAGVQDTWIGIRQKNDVHIGNGAWLSLLNFAAKQKRHTKLIGSLSNNSEHAKYKFMTNSEICPLWSRPLNAIDPSSNRFDEIGLAYG